MTNQASAADGQTGLTEFEQSLLADLQAQQGQQSQASSGDGDAGDGGSGDGAGGQSGAQAQAGQTGGDNAAQGSEGSNQSGQGDNIQDAFKSIQKPWEQNNQQQAAAGSSDGNQAAQKDATELSKEIETLKSLIERPSVKALLAAEAEGKTIFDIVSNEVKTPDVRKMTDEDVYKHDLKELELSEAEIEDEMDRWNSMGPAERKRTVSKLREQYASKREGELSKYADSAFSSVKEMKDKEATMLSRSAEAIESKLTSLKGQKLFGVLDVDDSAINQIKSAISNGELLPKKADGTYDEAALIELAALAKLKNLVFDNIAKSAFKSAYDVFVNENSVARNPVSNTGAGSGASKGIDDIIKDDIEKLQKQGR